MSGVVSPQGYVEQVKVSMIWDFACCYRVYRYQVSTHSKLYLLGYWLQNWRLTWLHTQVILTSKVSWFLYSLVLTCTHLYSLVLTCTHLYSLVLTCTHLYSLVLTCTHLYSRFYMITSQPIILLRVVLSAWWLSPHSCFKQIIHCTTHTHCWRFVISQSCCCTACAKHLYS